MFESSSILEFITYKEKRSLQLNQKFEMECFKLATKRNCCTKRKLLLAQVFLTSMKFDNKNVLFLDWHKE